MKRSGFDHPKLGRLCKILSVPRYAAVGLVESLWHFTAKHAPAGDVGKWSDDEIGDALGWDGDSGSLVSAMIEARLLDESDSHRLTVHDWEEHCDDSVHNCIARKVETFASGKLPKLTRLGTKERKKIVAAYKVAATHARERSACDEKRLQASENAQPSPALPSPALPCHVEKGAASAAAPERAKPVVAADVEFPAGMDTPENREALDRWLTYKRGKRKSYKDPDQVRLMLAEFLKNNGAAVFVDAVNHSIGMNYEGCFPPKRGKQVADLGAGQQHKPGKELAW